MTVRGNTSKLSDIKADSFCMIYFTAASHNSNINFNACFYVQPGATPCPQIYYLCLSGINEEKICCTARLLRLNKPTDQTLSRDVFVRYNCVWQVQAFVDDAALFMWGLPLIFESKAVYSAQGSLSCPPGVTVFWLCSNK